ncbi:PPOX class F420-dependent oxidoreductase [Yimella sp. RIT 621]|uniref:PPOX class F420-dependent oxidoreductase n=1 Tax=Yimella sp. RIT 621 TaxID=2510323 RepID=UPI00101D4D0C|nr:PPOX class F420-dependent oxidoreductase [Yimella sp. RIT 621]RYG76264.1 PPOX class F420-dependent oxidoreductase [Yimella sp. RIT 621]
MTSLSDEKYLLLTTYKKDGTPVSTPVWIAALPDGRAGFTTDYDSWKVKRLKRNPKVMLQPCSVRGEPVPGSAITDAIAVAAPAGSAEHEAVERAIKKKYPVMMRLLMLGMKVRSMRGSAVARGAVIVTI